MDPALPTSHTPGAPQRVVVIGASAGGLEALRELVGGLPPDFAAPVLIVVHVSAHSPNALPRLLDRRAPLSVVSAEDGETLRAGVVYVALPDHHLVVSDGTVHTTHGPRENRFRPAIDPLFRSAALSFRAGAIGVILSGGLDDGTAGLATIKQMGGLAVVQTPEDAQFPSMPLSAIRSVDTDYIVPVAEMPALLTRLTATVPAPPNRLAPSALTLSNVEVGIAMDNNAIGSGVLEIGEPSSFACPECHGVMLRIKDEGPLRFRCHTGHAYTVASLIASLNEAIEAAMWNAIRSLEEGALLLDYIAVHAEKQHGERYPALHRSAEQTRMVSNLVREAALQREELTPADGAGARGRPAAAARPDDTLAH